MRRSLNQGTQPIPDMPVFQNWRVVAEAWYFAIPSRELRCGQAVSMNLCGQHVALFRGADGTVRALDGFCPHMGTDLGIGSVKGNYLACFFHGWEFDGEGACRRVPCGEVPPGHACLQSYAVTERFGGIWVFPSRAAAFPLPDFDALAGAEVTVAFEKSYTRTCHHHVTMINGIDVQHLRSVHGFDTDMTLQIENRRPDLIDFSLEGPIPSGTWRERLMGRLLGGEYGYSMRYSAGSVGLLTILKKVRLFGRVPLAPLQMIFAYRPVRLGEILVQPIYVTRKRPGVLGKLIERLLLGLTRRAFLMLKEEDGKIYDNMRFNPGALLSMDRPIQVFIDQINSQTPSMWSH